MARINPPAREDAPAETQPVLDNLIKRFGFAPNLFRLMSMNPNVLAAFMSIQGDLSIGGALARVAWAAAISAAEKIKGGSFDGLAGGTPGTRLNGMFGQFN